CGRELAYEHNVASLHFAGDQFRHRSRLDQSFQLCEADARSLEQLGSCQRRGHPRGERELRWRRLFAASADAINAMGQSGILFVAAAGNDAVNSDVQHHYPSGYSLANVISVAATTSSDTLASFSNFGAQTVMLGAPGSGILSTTPGN